VSENNEGGDNKVERDILSKSCAEWEKLERKSTMILDQKLRELTDKNKSLSRDVQETNEAVSNKLISDLCIKLEKLERKPKMALDQQKRDVRVDNKLLSKELNKATNKEVLVMPGESNQMIISENFQSFSGLASADPPGIFTVCNVFWGDIRCATSYELSEVSLLL
jgi:hypothetical protein